MSGLRYRVLLLLALFLVGVRFLFMPWLEYSSSRHDSLEVVTRRFERSQELINSRRAINEYSSSLAEGLGSIKGRYPIAASTDEYRILMQQEIANIAQRTGTNITVFDFLLDGERPDANLGYIRVRVQLQGPMTRIARFHAEVEGRLQNVLVRNFRVDTNDPVSGPSDSLVRSSMLLDSYFRLQAEEK